MLLLLSLAVGYKGSRAVIAKICKNNSNENIKSSNSNNNHSNNRKSSHNSKTSTNTRTSSNEVVVRAATLESGMLEASALGAAVLVFWISRFVMKFLSWLTCGLFLL